MSKDKFLWVPRTELLKFKSHEDVLAGRYYERKLGKGNIVTTAGIQALWKLLVADADAPAPFSLANAHIGVGSGTTAATTGDTGLTGPNIKLLPVDQTDGIVITQSDPVTVTFKTTFDVGDAVFTWNEWGIFNGSDPSTAVMLNHKIEANGTKSASDIWIYSVTLGLQQATDAT